MGSCAELGDDDVRLTNGEQFCRRHPPWNRERPSGVCSIYQALGIDWR